MKKLQETLLRRLENDIFREEIIDNNDSLLMFLSAKQVEGCSKRTITYYQSTIEKMLSVVKLNVRKITTECIRDYLKDYIKINDCSKLTIDNIRNLSSFFSWLEEIIF